MRLRVTPVLLLTAAAILAEVPQPRMYTTGMKQGYMTSRAVPNVSGTSPVATQLVPMQGMIAWHMPEDLAGSDLSTIGWSTSTQVNWPNRAKPSAPAASNNIAYNCQIRTNVIGSYRGVQCGAASTPCGPDCGFLVMPSSYDISNTTWFFVVTNSAPITGSNPLQTNGSGNVTFGPQIGPGGAGGNRQHYSWGHNANGFQYNNPFNITTSTSPQIIGYSMGSNGPFFYLNGAIKRPWGNGSSEVTNGNVYSGAPSSLSNSNVYLGGVDCNTCTFKGQIVEVMAWNRQLSRQEAQAVQAYLFAKFPRVGRGLVNLVQYGDSIEDGQGSTWGNTQSEARYVGRSAGAAPYVFSWGYSGREWLNQEVLTYSKYFVNSMYDPVNPGMLNPFASQNIVTFKYGSNDFWAYFQTAAATEAAMNAAIADFKLHGWDKVYIGTVIPRYSGAGSISGEVQAKLYNAWLLAGTIGGNASSFQGDGVIDYTAIPCFGWGDGSNNHVFNITKNLADNGSTPVKDPTATSGCYQTSDNTHPTDVGHTARALVEYNFYHGLGIF